MGGSHHAEVVDAGGLRDVGGRLGNSFVGVAPDDKGDGRPGRLAFEEHVDMREILGNEPQFHSVTDQGWVDAVLVSFQGNTGGLGDLAGHRPPECLDQHRRVRLTMGATALEPLDGCLLRLGVDPLIGHLFGPGRKQIVQFVDRLDAPMCRFCEERLSDVAVQPFLLSPAFRRVGLGVHQPGA